MNTTLSTSTDFNGDYLLIKNFLTKEFYDTRRNSSFKVLLSSTRDADYISLIREKLEEREIEAVNFRTIFFTIGYETNIELLEFLGKELYLKFLYLIRSFFISDLENPLRGFSSEDVLDIPLIDYELYNTETFKTFEILDKVKFAYHRNKKNLLPYIAGFYGFPKLKITNTNTGFKLSIETKSEDIILGKNTIKRNFNFKT